MTRLRLRYTKLGKIRFIGHRDLARVWERALRRSGLPVASTEGFSPRPKVHFGLALSTGYESLGEYLDVDLYADAERFDPESSDLDEAVPSQLSELLPQGIEVQAAAIVARGMSLQEAVVACDWRVELAEVDVAEVAGRAEDLMASASLVLTRERKGREVTADVRTSLERLEVLGPVDRAGWGYGVSLAVRVGTVAPALKLAELVAMCAPEVADHRVVRLHQWIEGEGARQEPLPLATPLAHAGVCAP